LTDLEIAWIAGLLEGEGSFGIARRVVKNKVLPDRLSLQPVARIGMTDRDVIERFARLVGVAFNQQHTRRGARKPLYQAAVSNRRALLLMERIRPMMGERRQRQIDAAVSGSNSPRLAAAA
jgi:hypothetical protein